MAKRQPRFGAGKNELRDQKVAELVDHIEAMDGLIETQSSVIFALRQELTELREHVAEMNLRSVFTMRQMQFRRKASQIADANGQVPTVVETLMDRYRNGGRDTLLAALEAENAEIAKQEEAARAEVLSRPDSEQGEPGSEPTSAPAEGTALEPTAEDAEQIAKGRTH